MTFWTIKVDITVIKHVYLTNSDQDWRFDNYYSVKTGPKTWLKHPIWLRNPSMFYNASPLLFREYIKVDILADTSNKIN